MNTDRAQQADLGYTFICTYISQNAVLPQLQEVSDGCDLSRQKVLLAIWRLQSEGRLYRGSLLPTAHFPLVPF